MAFTAVFSVFTRFSFRALSELPHGLVRQIRVPQFEAYICPPFLVEPWAFIAADPNDRGRAVGGQNGDFLRPIRNRLSEGGRGRDG